MAWRRVQGHPKRGAIGTAGRGQPRYRQDRLERQDAATADRRRARHRGQPRVQRRGQWLVQGVRRQDRQGAVEVQLRGRCQRARGVLYGRRQAVCRRCCGREQPDRRQARQ